MKQGNCEMVCYCQEVFFNNLFYFYTANIKRISLILFFSQPFIQRKKKPNYLYYHILIILIVFIIYFNTRATLYT